MRVLRTRKMRHTSPFVVICLLLNETIQIEILWKHVGLSSRVTDVAFCVQLFGNFHGFLGVYLQLTRCGFFKFLE